MLDAQRVDEARREVRQQRLRPAGRDQVGRAAEGREAARAQREQVQAKELLVRGEAAWVGLGLGLGLGVEFGVG